MTNNAAELYPFIPYIYTYRMECKHLLHILLSPYNILITAEYNNVTVKGINSPAYLYHAF